MKENTDLALNGGAPVRKSVLAFGVPDLGIDEEKAVAEVIKSNWIGTGPRVSQFTEELKCYIGPKSVVATNSASAALHVALAASGVGPGDEVITSSITFPSTVNMIEHCGAKPVFVDVDPKTGLIDVNLIEAVMTDKAKAILPIHLYGYPVDMDRVWKLGKKYGVSIIEDAAEALGAEYRGQRIGARGDFITFSFAVNKLISCAEGGALVTNLESIEEKLSEYVLHGMDRKALQKYPYNGFKEHYVVRPGFKYNMTDLHAAVGLAQLGKIDKFIKRRREVWERYDQALQNLPLQTPEKPTYGTHGMCFYAVQLDLDKLNASKSEIQSALLKEGIGTAVHFFPMHLQPYYKDKYHFNEGDLPHAEKFAKRSLSIPFTSGLSDEDIEDVIKAVNKVITYYSR